MEIIEPKELSLIHSGEDVNDFKKRVRFDVPEETTIQINDHMFRTKIELEWIPDLQLSKLQRFHPDKIFFYEKYDCILNTYEVICRDKHILININEPLINQGIEPGDTIDIFPIHKRYELFYKNQRKPKTKRKFTFCF
jgi:hypothetical protein